MPQFLQINQKKKRGILFVIAIVTLVITGISGIVAWLNQGRTLYATAVSHHTTGDCVSALSAYNRITRYPSFTGDFVNQAATNSDECMAYEEAAQSATGQSVLEQINAYESFLAAYPHSPLTPLAIEKIGRNHLAWGGSLRDDGRFAEAIDVYESLASHYPLFNPQAVEQIHQTYLNWADGLRQANDFSDALPIYREMVASYPDTQPQAHEQILATYLAWGETERTVADFPAAIVIYDELRADYPAFSSQAAEELITTYLEWARHLRQAEQFSATITTYDALTARQELVNETIAEVILPLRNQVYLDWAAASIADGMYDQAEQIYRLLLQREHDRLRPLSLPAEPWPIPQLYPYGVARVAPTQLLQITHMGPADVYDPAIFHMATGDAFAAPESSESLHADALFAIVGSNPDNTWFALDMGLWIEPEAELATLSALNWRQEATRLTVWLPANQVEMVLGNEDEIPLFGGLPHKLSAESEWAAEAAAGLQALYTLQEQLAQEQGNLLKAITMNMALAELSPDEATRQQLRQQIAALYLEMAQSFANRGAYQASLEHVTQAEMLDITGELALAAHSLRINSLMASGDLAAQLRHWDTAVTHYTQILDIEKSRFTVSQPITPLVAIELYPFPDLSSTPVYTLDATDTLSILAQSNISETGWLLVLAPTLTQAQAWTPAAPISHTVADLPDYGALSLPALHSHTALQRLAQAQQAWGQELYATNQYEDALTHYYLILDDPMLQAVITGTAALAAQTWAGWGQFLMHESNYVEAIARFAQAIQIAPESEAATVASDSLASILNETEQAVAAAGGCDEVIILDAFIVENTPLAPVATGLLPQALFQCGQASVANTQLANARVAYQRILDDFPRSTYGPQVGRELQKVTWLILIDSRGLHSAADQVCRAAGNSVQAGFSTVTKPYILFVHGDTISFGLIPPSWRGADAKTTIIACIGEPEQALVQRCPYSIGGFHTNAYIERYRYLQKIRLVDPISRLTVRQGAVYGTSPETCPYRAWFSGYGAVAHYYGDYPDDEDLANWIKQQIPNQ